MCSSDLADPAANLSWPGTSSAPNAPAGWDPFPATTWPIGVPKNSWPARNIEADQAFSEIGGSRGGTTASPPADPESWSLYHNTTVTDVWPRNPYIQTPRTMPATDSVDVLEGGPGASPYMEAQWKDWDGGLTEYRYREFRESPWIAQRLDGNRHVPDAVIATPGMDGDVGLMAVNFTVGFVDNTPGWNSGTYVTTQAAGTTTAGPTPAIPNAVTVVQDTLPRLSFGL